MKAYLNPGRIARGALLALALAALAALPSAAQDSFGFAEDAEAGSAGSAPAALGARVGGTIDFTARSFFKGADEALDTPLSGIASGLVALEAKGASVDAVLKLELSKATACDSPEDILDEAFARAYLGRLTLEGGLLKLAWGKADSLGPLNVLNPMDYTDLTVTDEREQRIARPMLHASYALGDLSKLEIALLPGFEGDRYAWEGRWTQKRISAQRQGAYASFYYGTDPTANNGKGNGLYANYYATAWSTAYSSYFAGVYATAYATALGGGLTAEQAAAAATAATDGASHAAAMNVATAAADANAAAIGAQASSAAEALVADLLDYPDTETLEYAQGGLRLTTTLGPIDLGLQYFYGFLPKPAASADPAAIAANGNRVPISYNRYHQAGMDFAAVAFGNLNIRGEIAANLTEDLEGDDPAVYNPFLAWSLGLDTGLFAGLSLNLQGSGSYRLFDDKVGGSSYDIESGSELTSTRLTAALTQKLFKDAVDWKIAAIVEVEEEDFLLMPSLAFAIGDARIELAAGIFAGDEEGSLGQYADNSYASASISYSF